MKCEELNLERRNLHVCQHVLLYYLMSSFELGYCDAKTWICLLNRHTSIVGESGLCNSLQTNSVVAEDKDTRSLIKVPQVMFISGTQYAVLVCYLKCYGLYL